MSIHTSALWCGWVRPDRMVVSLLPTCTCVLGRPACPAISTPKCRRPSRSSGERSAPGLPAKARGFLDPARPYTLRRTQARVAPGGRRGCPHAGRGSPRGQVRGDVAPIHRPRRTARRDPRTGFLQIDDGPRILRGYGGCWTAAVPAAAVATVVTPIGQLRGYEAGKGNTWRLDLRMVELGPPPEALLLRIIVTSTVFPRGSNNDECGTSSPNRVV